MTKWLPIGKKADETGAVWVMHEWNGIVRRRTWLGSGGFQATLYWRRGTFSPDGRPVWVRYISDITEGTQNGK